MRLSCGGAAHGRNRRRDLRRAVPEAEEEMSTNIDQLRVRIEALEKSNANLRKELSLTQIMACKLASNAQGEKDRRRWWRFWK